MTTSVNAPAAPGYDTLETVCRAIEASLVRCAAELRDPAPREAIRAAADLIGDGRDVPASSPDVRDLIQATQEAAAVFARNGLDQPRHVIERVGESLSWLDHHGGGVDELVQLAPEALCEAGGFDLVVISRVDGSTWVEQARHAVAASADLPGSALVASESHPLVSGSAEAEAVRRRLPALVTPIDTAEGGVSYVVAPVIVGEVVIGLVHARIAHGRRMLSELDRVAVQTFSEGLGVIVERVVLRKRLESQSRRLNEALRVAANSINDIGTRSNWVFSPAVTAKRSRTESVIHDGLTERERDVLQLLVSGATNGQIADRLTVSETTVKSHVRHILHKLRVSNRGEAIAKYLASRPAAVLR